MNGSFKVYMLSQLSMWILTLLGWEVHADYPGVNKYVVIAAPHTSNWDFPLGILAAKAVNLKIYWMGKHALFRWPWGWFFRAVGGTPVDREQSLNLSQQMAELFARSEHLVLALAPEGTRAKKDHWKTGFYYIARAANVPIVMGYLDFGQKQVGIGGTFYPGDDIEEDFKHIRQFYKNRQGKIPENESLIKIRPQKD
jgi:1-acyl-sn-glycerol-3-phosphate acyltransferase